MSDIKELLDRTGRSTAATPSPDIVESDVRRGRAALVRRRRRRAVGSSIASTVAATAIVATAIVLGSPGGSNEAPSAGPDRVVSPNAGASGVRLVTYTGEQPPGYIVEMVPEGWYIQDPLHPAYSLTIARNGDTSHPDSFAGKLAVMLLSSSARQELPEHGEPVEVDGHDGVVTRDGGSGGAALTYEDGAGHFVQIQSPQALGWSNDQLVSFAEGVTATAHAKAGVG